MESRGLTCHFVQKLAGIIREQPYAIKLGYHMHCAVIIVPRSFE